MGRAGGGVTNCGQQVPDGATVALVPCLTKHVLRESQDYVPGESEYPSPGPASPHHSPLPLVCPVSSNGRRSSGSQGGLPFNPMGGWCPRSAGCWQDPGGLGQGAQTRGDKL